MPVRELTTAASPSRYALFLLTPRETVVDDVQPWFAPLSSWRHFVAHGTLAYALDKHRDRARIVLTVITLAAGYGVLMEFGQVFVPNARAS